MIVSDRRFATLLMLPAAVFLAVFVGWPLLRFVIDSFFSIDLMAGERTFVGLDNYLAAFASEDFTNAAWRTLAYTLIVVVLEFVLGLGAALLFTALGDASRVFRTIFLYPLMIAPVVAGLLWRFLLIDNVGIVNELLARIGILPDAGAIAWLSDPDIALFSVAIPDIWLTTSFITLVLFAGLQNIPGDVIEAARLDGARFHHPGADHHPAAAAGDRGGADHPRRRRGPRLRRDPDPDQRRPPAEHRDDVAADLPHHGPLRGPGAGQRDGHDVPDRDDARGRPRRLGDLASGRGELMTGLVVTRTPARVLLWIALVLTVLLYGFPFLYMVLTSLKTPLETIAVPPRILPSTWTVQNYTDALGSPGVIASFVNSTITAALSTGFSLLLAIPAAYAVTRFRTRYGQVFIMLALVMRMVPPIVIGVPMVQIFQSTGIYDTSIALALAHTTISLPLSIWLLSSFFESVPVELEEAALIDGTGRLGALWRVVLPVTSGGIAVTAIFAFLASWNEFLYSLLLTAVRSQTTPIVIANFQTQFGLDWGAMTALAVLYSLPVILLTLALQRHIVAGMTLGAVKG